MTEQTESVKNNWFSLKLSELLSLIVSAVGIILVLITLNGHNSEFNTNTYTYLQTFSETYDIDKIFLQYPNLIPYFYDKASIAPTDSNYKKAAVAAELILDHLDAVLNNKSYFKEDTVAESSWVNYAVEKFRQSPILREIYYDDPGNWPILEAELCKRRSNIGMPN